MTKPFLTNVKCPNCGHFLTYEPAIPPITGGPADHWDPGSPSDLWCGNCSHEIPEEMLIDYEGSFNDY